MTSENWGLILEVCDKVTGEDNGAKDVCASMIKRLSHRNANVQLYTLELANALSQNCGTKMHIELASRAFTDALLRLANDRNTHQQVKTKILERMAEWTQMFSKDPSLGIMRDQYQKLKSQNPNLHPPSAPQKSRLTDIDLQKEEEELQMALKLSIQAAAEPAKSSNLPAPAEIGSSNTPGVAPVAVASGTTAATVSRVRALFDFVPSEPGELQFKKGDVIAVLESVFKDWWKGSLRGQTGIFPLNYVEKLADPTAEELQREAVMESEVFSEIKNVEKLLALLSTSNAAEMRGEDNEEITKLYHQTLSIRPKLIELIGKYSQKKDDFTQLNEKFIKARRDYESLLESSMAQPPPQQYGGYGRQPPPAQYGGYGGGYPPVNSQQPPNQQDPQRFYSPAPQRKSFCRLCAAKFLTTERVYKVWWKDLKLTCYRTTTAERTSTILCGRPAKSRTRRTAALSFKLSSSHSRQQQTPTPSHYIFKSNPCQVATSSAVFTASTATIHNATSIWTSTGVDIRQSARASRWLWC